MRIKEILLASNDLMQTRSFYTQTLGFTISDQTDNRISFHAGDSILTFLQNNLETSPVYHFAFNIPHNQLAQAINWLTARVALIPVTEENIIADFRQWNANAVYFTDNNGNILEFIARYDLDNSSDIPFSAASVQCISEIGIAVADVPHYAEQLIEDYALNYFSKQPPQEKFVALGNDDGLLIIAELNRNWYPTDIPAGRFYMEIVIEHNNHIRRLIQ
jgi:catechol-2,3-dioxygenase